MSKLPDRYSTQDSEKKQQKFWAEKKIYKWQNDLPKHQTFVIDTPPPTVSGLLHMGHIFSYTQSDFVARYKRMKGFDVFYPMGFDDNGLPTERLVEKAIGKKAGVYEAENGRGSFVKECQKIVDVAEVEFENLFNAVALSVDWDQKYQTISPESQKISQASFIDLFNKKLVERKYEPVFWDVSDRTALAQADLIDKEVEGVMSNVEFGIEGSEEKIIIMTTRPELLPACIAVMIKKDGIWSKFKGKTAVTPLFEIRVPIIEVDDDSVNEDKGTGAVMCCTFGDETDIKWWKTYSLEYGLETRVILGEDGRTNWDVLSKIVTDSRFYSSSNHESFTNFHGSIDGRKIKEAKDWVIEELKAKGLLLGQETIKRSVKCAERSGVPIEILVVPQWFIKILDKKEKLKEKANECYWYPDYMKIRIDQWIDGLSWDWCISRQRFFGVKFPIWYIKKEHDLGHGDPVIAGIDQLEEAVKQRRAFDPAIDAPKGYKDYKLVHQIGKDSYFTAEKDGQRYSIRPETDIMDTWATSSISPQLSSKGISPEISFDKQRHHKLFPADLRPQAHEIIRTWAFYTIVKAMLHEDKIPWKSLMISGWCLAADKTKMSKSKGNVITPQSLIEEKGADVVRYWASASNLGADIAYSEELFKIGGKLITKLFNASKFVSQNFIDLSATPIDATTDVKNGIINEQADLWILSRLKNTILKYEEEFEQFEYARARAVVEDFFWNDFCDNYLEIVKVRSYGLAAEKYRGTEITDEERTKIVSGQQSGLHTLYHCLDGILRLFAPILPHVTEELYQAIFPNKLTSIHQRGSFCKATDYILDEEALKVGEVMKEVIFHIRKFKSDNNFSMKTPLTKFTIRHQTNIGAVIWDLENVCNTWKISFDNKNSDQLVSDIELELVAEVTEK